MKINYLQHVSFEGLGSIADWAREKRYETRAIRLFAGDSLPDTNEIDLLVVLGGPMNVDEEEMFTFLREEKRLIERIIEQKKPILGICLGAQLIAQVLGAKVYKGEQKEIGWFPVKKSPQSESCFAKILPTTFTTFHWHGDTFDLPEGAANLALSAAYQNQAFAYGDKVLGLQFHLEATPGTVRLMIENEAEEIQAETAASAKFVQTTQQILSNKDSFAENAELMRRLLDYLAGLEN